MKKSIFLLVLTVSILWGCSPKSDDNNDKDQPGDSNKIQSVTKIDSASLFKPKAVQVLKNYYAALEAEKMDETQFFAPTVSVFYNSQNISNAKIGESLRDGFKKMDNRKIVLDEDAVSCKQVPEGYELIVSGNSTHTDVAKKSTIQGVFINRIVMGRDMKITYYNVAPNAERGTGEMNELVFAEKMMASLKENTSLNEFIHPDKGVVLMYRSGAFDKIQTFKNADELKSKYEIQWKKIIAIRCGGIVMNKIPSFNCDTEFKEKGCFLSPVENFNEASRTAEELNKLNDRSINYNTRDRGVFKEMEGMVTHQLVLTEGKLLLGFGQIDGKWYLLEINSSKFDCSA